jgi:hypothetical protein
VALLLQGEVDAMPIDRSLVRPGLFLTGDTHPASTKATLYQKGQFLTGGTYPVTVAKGLDGAIEKSGTLESKPGLYVSPLNTEAAIVVTLDRIRRRLADLKPFLGQP